MKIFIILSIFLVFLPVLGNCNDSDLNYELYIYNFIIKGFGHDLGNRIIYGKDILHHFGGIKNINIKINVYDGREYLEIEFDTIYVKMWYSGYIEMHKNNYITDECFSSLRITSITAKNNINYLYNIRLGMDFDEFKSIFGEINENNRYYFNNRILSFGWGIHPETGEKANTLFMVGMRERLITGERDKFVTFRFNGNIIENITWVL